MTVTGFIGRLIAGYFALVMSLTFADFSIGVFGNTAAVAAIAYSLATQFGEKNRRRFTRREKLFVVGFVIAFDSMLQTVITVASLLLAAKASGIVAVGYGVLGLRIGAAVALHAVAVSYTIEVVESRLYKQGVLQSASNPPLNADAGEESARAG